MFKEVLGFNKADQDLHIFFEDIEVKIGMLSFVMSIVIAKDPDHVGSRDEIYLVKGIRD